MILDPRTTDNIQVGGDDLTLRNKKKFNFSGTQNLVLGSNNFCLVNQSKGFSPSNKVQEPDVKDFNSVGSSSTFGLSNINKKKQILSSAGKTNGVASQQYTIIENNVKRNNKMEVQSRQPNPKQASLTGTITNSQVTDPDQRNSNLPPNSA